MWKRALKVNVPGTVELAKNIDFDGTEHCLRHLEKKYFGFEPKSGLISGNTIFDNPLWLPQ